MVIGTSIDPHISAVLSKLKAGTVVARLDVDRYPRELRLTIKSGRRGTQLLLHDDSKVLDVSTPAVAWFRRLGKPGLDERVLPVHRSFCLNEVEQALDGLLSLTRPGLWVNDFWSSRRAANKPFQYAQARGAGLAVPETLVTNDWHEARAFATSNVVVAKTLSSPVVASNDEAQHFAFTNKLATNDLNDRTQVEVAPVQLQHLVDVDYELRVTSIGSRHHAVRIDQTSTRSTTVRDWRSDYSDITYRPAALPRSVVANLVELLARLNLQYAASDFIVDKQGNHHFLEVNPHGAWLWLEEHMDESFTAALGTVISRAIASSRASDR